MRTKSTKILALLAIGVVVFVGLLLGVSSWLDVREGPLPVSDAPPVVDAAARPDEPSVELERAPEVTSRRHDHPRLDASDERFTPNDNECALGTWIEREGGAPIRGAHLAVFTENRTENRNGAPPFPALVESAAAESGLVYAKTSSADDILVVAFAPGFEPLTRKVHPRLGERIELEPFRLAAGVSIRGRVRAGGKPLACAEVQADLAGAAEVVRLDGGVLAWHRDEKGGESRFVSARALARTDVNGRYTMDGVEPALQRVRLATIRCSDAALDRSRASMSEVQAPAEGVDFTLEAARLEIEVRAAGEPVAFADVQIEAGDTHWTRTADAAGRATLSVSPSNSYTVIARGPGFAPARRFARGLADGESTLCSLDLEPTRVPGSLVVVDHGKAGGNRALFQAESKPESWNKEGASIPPITLLTREINRTGDEFRVGELPPGDWRITMFSGERLDLYVNTPSHLPIWTNCQCAFDVTIPQTGALRKEIETQRRGALRLTVRDPAGEIVDAKLKVLSEYDWKINTDNDWPMEFAVTYDGVNGIPTPGILNQHKPALLYTAACAGPVRLAVSREGSQTRTLDVEIVPSITTDVDVVLQPK